MIRCSGINQRVDHQPSTIRRFFALPVPGLPLTDHHHGHHLLPEHRLALLHEAHDVKPRHGDLGFVLVLVLDLVLSESSPAVGDALLTRCGSALSRSGCSFLPVVGSSLLLL